MREGCAKVRDVCGFGFFFQAEDGIRDIGVTGVQTCALPIYKARKFRALALRQRNSIIQLLSRRAEARNVSFVLSHTLSLIP